MNKSILVGAAILAVMGSPAFAHGGGGMGPASWPPAAVPASDAQPLTRAEVKAELVKAEQDGTLAADEGPNYPAAHFADTPSTTTRAQVEAQVATATPADVQATFAH